MPSWSWSLGALSVGLAMDATTVAAARGLASRDGSAREGLSLAAAFGVAQALMPAIGWAAGHALGGWLEAWDHWVAFALLSLLGAKMLYEAAHAEKDEALPPLDPRLLVTLAVATSIDALAAGLTLPALGAPLGLSLVAIGVTTFVLGGAGFALGKRLGAMAGRRLDALGGIVLVGLGVKVLVEHLGAA